MSRPAITVITPTFNRGSYLAETIESVLSQDFYDIDYIILDDGSRDDTKAVVRRYTDGVSHRFPNCTLRYTYHDNIGEVRTVNKGLAMVKGEFFTIVNSDDPLMPGSLRKVVGALRSRPEALGAYPDWQVIDEESRHVTTVKLVDYDSTKLLTFGYVSIGPGACFRSSALDVVGFRNPLLRYSADLDFWYRLALHGPLVHVPETLATHRVHPTSASILEKGTRLADETAYLFSAYTRHPLLPSKRRLHGIADSHGQFAAMFACSTLTYAVRALVRSIGYHPVSAITRCKAVGALDLTRFFVGLGAKRNGVAEIWFPRVMCARDRCECFGFLARGFLRDPLGMIDLAQALGADSVLSFVRALPLFRRVRSVRVGTV